MLLPCSAPTEASAASAKRRAACSASETEGAGGRTQQAHAGLYGKTGGKQ